MSLEAWGDEGETGPEGYVTEEHVAEIVAETIERCAQIPELLAGGVSSMHECHAYTNAALLAAAKAIRALALRATEKDGQERSK